MFPGRNDSTDKMFSNWVERLAPGSAAFVESRPMGWYALGGTMCLMGILVLVIMFTIVADSFEFALPRFVFALPLVAIALLIGGSWLLVSQQRSGRATLHNHAVLLEEYRAE